MWLGTTAWDTGEARGALHDLGLVVLRPVIGARPQPVYVSVKRIFLIQSESFSNDHHYTAVVTLCGTQLLPILQTSSSSHVDRCAPHDRRVATYGRND